MRRVVLATAVAASLTGCGDVAAPPFDEPIDAVARRVYAGEGPFVLPAFAPGDDERLFVVEQRGVVRIAHEGESLAEPFLDLTSVVSPVSEQGRGLLSLAFHPDFRSNGEFFVSYTTQVPGTDRITSRIDRVRVSGNPNRADPSSRTLVLEVPQSLGDHNGGHIFFGPDGMLYFALGDGGSGDARGEAQNRLNHLGSILRIDVSGQSPYRVPADNPFVDDSTSLPEVLVWGMRNPWRPAFDVETGDLWIADVGESEWEEITVIRRADLLRDDLNLGWPFMEGRECFQDSACTPSDFVVPSVVYSHDDGCSVVGGPVYRGSELSALVGRYLFADYCHGWIEAVPATDPGEAARLVSVDLGGEHPISFGTNNAGEVYLSTFEGSVFRLEPVPGNR
jgi:glucose/arabinose dehydrogenase